MIARPKLSLARTPKRPSLALVKKAIRLYRSKSVPREVWKANAIKWLRSVEFLGERHILKGKVCKGGDLKGREASWGRPGDGKGVSQIHAPRQLKGA